MDNLSQKKEEQIMVTPKDTVFEIQDETEDVDNPYEDMEDYPFFEDDEEFFAMTMDEADERQIMILKWLADSPMAEPVQGGSRDDFFIRRGWPVRLEDGPMVEAVSWLENEGFDEYLLVEGYTVSTDFVDGADGEALIFRKREVIDAPFRYSDGPGSGFYDEELPGDEKDIPF